MFHALKIAQSNVDHRPNQLADSEQFLPRFRLPGARLAGA